MESEEARNWFRHSVGGPLFFNLSPNAVPLDHSDHVVEAELLDVSEQGIRFKTKFTLKAEDIISFDISPERKTIFSGVAQIIHQIEEQTYGAKYIKIKKHT